MSNTPQDHSPQDRHGMDVEHGIAVQKPNLLRNTGEAHAGSRAPRIAGWQSDAGHPDDIRSWQYHHRRTFEGK